MLYELVFYVYDSGSFFYSEESEILDSSFIDTFSECDSYKTNDTIPQLPEFSDTLIEKSIILTDYSIIIKNVKKWLDKKESFINGNRNRYVTQFVGALHRYGLPENIANDEALNYKQDGFTTHEIESLVKTIYRNVQWFNTAKFEIGKEFLPDDGDHKQSNIATPLLPIEGFPEYLQNFINEYYNVYKIPRDFIAASVIISYALAIGNKLELIGKYKNVPVLLDEYYWGCIQW